MQQILSIKEQHCIGHVYSIIMKPYSNGYILIQYRHLVNVGADIYLTDYQQQTPVDLAEENQSHESIRVFTRKER